MKIKFFSDYDKTENLLKRFMMNYNVYDQALQFTTDDDYDYAVVFNRSYQKIKDAAKVITIVQEPSWSTVHPNNQFLTNSDYLIIHDRELFENLYQIELGKKVFEAPSYMFFHDHVDKSFFQAAEQVPKTKKLSMIVSSLAMDVGNYGKRLRLVRKILASDLDIDIYGKGYNLTDERYKGMLEFKHTGLMPYEYSIAVENCQEKNYITEKFVDCVLCNTIPIYSGAPNVSEVYNEKYFRTINLDSPTIIDDIREIIKTPAPKQIVDSNKDRYFKQRNTYQLIKDIVKLDSQIN
ncbi:glycosyltransferase family 10 [Pedobacter sp. FW305-3-2-15-E-R2A2]|uniref:glycosyltransferase family 10 domain-containing protein n=1 Tax=Pedobacter sp. FW305-3-2-15-E-R2A2 TaxID=3140251 RepID=UPI0031402D78